MDIKQLEEYIDTAEVTDELSGDNEYLFIHNGNSIYIDFTKKDPSYYLLIIIVHELEFFALEKWNGQKYVEYLITQDVFELIQELQKLL